MSEKTQQVAIRLPVSLLKRVDRYRKQLEAEATWATRTRADAVRALLARGLDAVEAEKSSSKKAK